MIIWRTGTVTAYGKSWTGAQELTVHLDLPLHKTAPDGGVGGGAGGATTEPLTQVRALAYTDLVGTPGLGDRVTVNAAALARSLGTGGYAYVIANTTVPTDPAPGPGHLVKARYTPQQTLVLGVDEQQSPHHDLLRDADSLDGTPVVIADLHSALPAIITGARFSAARAGRPAPRVVYVMPDGGALPIAFSRTVAGLRDAEWITASITVGQAFGGDYEAVTLHSGLLAAHLVCEADLIVVAQGPGNLGTGTKWGFTGVAVGEAVNAINTLGGRAIASLRISGADPRDRHLGISHHSLTAYARVALTPADVVVPQPQAEIEALAAWGPGLSARITAQVSELVAPAGRHQAVPVAADAELLAALHAAPVGMSTMGRGLDQDPASFLAAAVAGVHAEGLARG